MADLLRFFAFHVNNLTCGRDNLNSFLCILLKFGMHVTNKQISDMFNNGCKKFKMTDLVSKIRPFGRNNLKSFSCILPKFGMHVTSDQFSEK